MKKILFILLILLLFNSYVFAEMLPEISGLDRGLSAKEEDGDPDLVDLMYIVFPNGSIIDNADGTASITSSGFVSDIAYDSSWDNVTTIGASKNAIYDKIESLAGGHDAATGSNTSDINIVVTGQDFNITINPTLKQTWNEKGTSNFTNTEVRAALLSLIPGIIYNTTTGNFTLNASNYFPLATDKTLWDGKGTSNLTDADIDENTNVTYGVTAYGWGNHATQGYLTNTSTLSGDVTGTPNATVITDANVDHNSTGNYSALRHFLQSDISITHSQISDFTAGVDENANVTKGVTAEGWGDHSIAGYAADADLTTHTGNTTIHWTANDKTYLYQRGTSNVTVNNTAYGAGWNGVATETPSHDAVYDQMELKLAITGTGAGLTGVTNVTNNRHGWVYTITNGTSAITTTGWIGFTEVSNAVTLTRTSIKSTDFTKGNATIVVKRCPALAAGIQNITEANFTTAGNYTISGSNVNIDGTLTGWTTTWNAGDLIGFNITSIDAFKGLELRGNTTGI